jgi:uncharacterized protein
MIQVPKCLIIQPKFVGNMEDIDNSLLNVLACPVCRGALKYEKEKQTLLCQKCKIRYPIKDGIPILMPPNLKQK